MGNDGESMMAKSKAAHRACAAMVASLLALPAFAQDANEDPRRLPVSEVGMLGYLPDGSTFEARLDRDFNGDGTMDVAYVGGNEDKRELRVLFGEADEYGIGVIETGALELDVTPLGAASLSLKDGVLVVEDLTGGTTATATTYRYRYDAKAKRMRLIGLDAERYSRTFSHDTLKISWNLLTGAHETVRGILNTKGGDDAAYDYTKPERTVRKSKPVYLDGTPNPDELIDAEVVPAGEDRD